MDFLDPKKQRQHIILLFIGYALVGVGILIATIILLYTAYGFGVGKNGQIIQNGLVFFSSQPGAASIYLDGQPSKSKTNTRLSIPSGEYSVKLQRDGYRTWQRGITVEGGDVQHYDYPFLFPTNLETKNVKTIDGTPPLATQSPDRRWLLVNQPDSFTDFTLYDLANPKNVVTTPLALPTDLVSSDSQQSWQLIEWSTDNQRVLLRHDYGANTEYIVVDRTDTSKSVNLSRALNLQAGQIPSLKNKKYNQYYVYDPAAKTLSTATLDDPTFVPTLAHVLAFKSYGNNMVLYATDLKAPAGKTEVMLQQGNDSFRLREVSAAPPYMLELAQYSGDWYMVMGASGDSKVYIYKNPVSDLQNKPNQPLVPVYVLKTPNPTYVSFSSSAEFMMTENGSSFAVYDAETKHGYLYDTHKPLDAPQLHANWMDGNRLNYVSQGKLEVFDFDGVNEQTLVTALPSYVPFFARDFKTLYTLQSTETPNQTRLAGTSLLTPQDQ